ncbi:WhiB family transcriptional regulator [Nakamurella sp. A5-74]|uniref:WhiB family transcriptional regulator n=1 Tax=Nakamurella sp. A5-74 TaxID=3158264 RepID=A0AAU8DK69_9ACTN
MPRSGDPRRDRRMSAILGIRADALPAWRALHDAIADADRPTPCRSEPDTWSDPATTELADYAATLCGRCPAVEQCRIFADLNREPAGVWAGALRAPRRGRPPTTRREAS